MIRIEFEGRGRVHAATGDALADNGHEDDAMVGSIR